MDWGGYEASGSSACRVPTVPLLSTKETGSTHGTEKEHRAGGGGKRETKTDARDKVGKIRGKPGNNLSRESREVPGFSQRFSSTLCCFFSRSSENEITVEGNEVRILEGNP